MLTYGRFLTIEEHAVRLPDGRTIPDWPWIITPSYAIVVAVTTELAVLCFRQVKYAIPEASLALPGGYIEPDEEPLAAAQRELLEEAGHTADTWKSLGSYVVDPRCRPAFATNRRPLPPPARRTPHTHRGCPRAGDRGRPLVVHGA